MRSVKKLGLGAGFGTGLLMSVMSPANATLIATPGANPGAPFDSVDITACNSAGNPAVSCLTSNNTVSVTFQGTENLEFQGTQVQASGGISPHANDWGFNDVTISLGSGYTFSQIVLKIDLHADDTLTFSSNLDPNLLVAATSTGNSDYTISSDQGALTWLRIQSGDYSGEFTVQGNKTSFTDGNISDLKNISFNGVTAPCTANCGPGPSVPEPASLLLLGSALLGYGATRRKKAV